MTDKIPFRVQPMLATLVPEPFDRSGWVYEEKYDGFRILAYKEGASVSLLSRNGKDRTQTYPNIAAAIAKLPYRTLLLDGEVVAFDNQPSLPLSAPPGRQGPAALRGLRLPLPKRA